MARITHVKRAQQRYAVKPVIDPTTGEQKVVPMLNRRTGEQKVTKRGRPVVMRVTERDTSRPAPMPECDYPNCKHESRTIKVGEPYKHITPKSGPYGGRTRNRHGDCPSWNVWDYSSSLSAMVAQIDHGYRNDIDAANNEDDVTAALEAAAEAVRDLAEQKRESAQNMEEGFGHSTYASEELEQTADDLDGWADDIESADVPALEDFPCETCGGDGEADCDECSGHGMVDDEQCESCGGDGVTDCQDCDDDHLDIDAWREAVESDVTVMDECPV